MKRPASSEFERAWIFLQLYDGGLNGGSRTAAGVGAWIGCLPAEWTVLRGDLDQNRIASPSDAPERQAGCLI
jgi:hypothetical protein